MSVSDPVWLSLLLTLLVAIGTLVGFMVNRRDARKASVAAERALKASLDRTASQGDMAQSLRQLAGRTETLESVIDQYLPRRAAEWELSHRHGDAYELQNVGEASGYEVRVTSPNALRLDVRAPNPAIRSWLWCLGWSSGVVAPGGRCGAGYGLGSGRCCGSRARSA